MWPPKSRTLHLFLACHSWGCHVWRVLRNNFYFFYLYTEYRIFNYGDSVMGDSVTCTPIKIKEKICIVCGKSEQRARLLLIHSPSGMKKNLHNLLLKYGGVNITEDFVCSVDEGKLINLDRKTSAIRESVTKVLLNMQCTHDTKRGIIEKSPEHGDPPGTKPSLNKPYLDTPKSSLQTIKTSMRLFISASMRTILPKPLDIPTPMEVIKTNHEEMQVDQDHAFSNTVKTPKSTTTGKATDLTPSPEDHGYSHVKLLPMVKNIGAVLQYCWYSAATIITWSTLHEVPTI